MQSYEQRVPRYTVALAACIALWSVGPRALDQQRRVVETDVVRCQRIEVAEPGCRASIVLEAIEGKGLVRLQSCEPPGGPDEWAIELMTGMLVEPTLVLRDPKEGGRGEIRLTMRRSPGAPHLEITDCSGIKRFDLRGWTEGAAFTSFTLRDERGDIILTDAK